MLICLECGAIFEEEQLVGGKKVFAGSETEPPEYEERVCPECGSDWWEEAAKCAVCGKYYNGKDGDDICPDCQAAVVDTIDKLAEELSAGDVADARDAIVRFIAEVM